MHIAEFTSFAVQGRKDAQSYDVTYDCPRCKTQRITGDGLAIGSDVAIRCRGCRKVTLVEMVRPGEVGDYFPKWEPSVESEIPESIASDYMDAQRCFSVGAHKAAAVMARRAVQSLVLHLWDKTWKDEPNGYDIRLDIHRLRDAGKITNVLDDAAQTLRILGVYGAHPKDDGLQEITFQDARDALEICEHLLHYTVVLPARIRASRASVEVGVPPRKPGK